ncbi:uncharacterized protein LOC127287620 [Leptopilina boulardi]|uniref:uncharacterized protein LOC127287620 n=1 Tax=Leptopilina boulardi TaxID=63433 RepID=UPI0021F55281|nr:uncharacterized protein LOC127287620 [Leptopilina boulardi]
MFDYEHVDEPVQSAEKEFEINFFNAMIDRIAQDIKWRFNALNEYHEQFGFIYDINCLKSLSKEDLLKHCSNLGEVLREGENSDIQSHELYEELQIIQSTLPKDIIDGKQLLQYIVENNLQEIYPNSYIIIRILLTIPVNTASAERFFKVKIDKEFFAKHNDPRTTFRISSFIH